MRLRWPHGGGTNKVSEKCEAEGRAFRTTSHEGKEGAKLHYVWTYDGTSKYAIERPEPAGGERLVLLRAAVQCNSLTSFPLEVKRGSPSHRQEGFENCFGGVVAASM